MASTNTPAQPTAVNPNGSIDFNAFLIEHINKTSESLIAKIDSLGRNMNERIDNLDEKIDTVGRDIRSDLGERIEEAKCRCRVSIPPIQMSGDEHVKSKHSSLPESVNGGH